MPSGPMVVLVDFLSTVGGGCGAVESVVVVVSVDSVDGLITTGGGFSTVLRVTVFLVTVGAAGTVVAVESVSVVVCGHAVTTVAPKATANAVAGMRIRFTFMSVIHLCELNF